MGDPVEVTTRYVTTVDDLPTAWAFVMSRIDQVGPSPRVTINPIWSWDASEGLDTSVRRFEIVVEGMTPEPEQADP